MAITESMRVRAPRGTRTLTQAFFAALRDIPEPRRAEVAKAAQLAIREELRALDYKDRTGHATRASGNGRRRRKAVGRPRGAATKRTRRASRKPG